MKRILPLRVQYIIASMLSMCCVFVEIFDCTGTRTKSYGRFEKSTYTYTYTECMDGDWQAIMICLLFISILLFVIIRNNNIVKLLHFLVFIGCYIAIYANAWSGGTFNWLVIFPCMVLVWHSYLHIKNIDTRMLPDILKD